MFIIVVRRFDMSMEYSITVSTRRKANKIIRFVSNDSTFAFIK